MEMSVSWILFPAILVSFFVLSSQNQLDHDNLIGELQDAKLKISRLEIVLEESVQKINAKGLYLEEREKAIQDMYDKIQYLQSALLNLKDDTLSVDERLNALEEEVRMLWAASRTNNFDLHNLEAKVQDAEDKLQVLTSQVEQTAAVVTEQWIQIQHLEQALQITKIRVLTVQKERFMRCTFLKFLSDIYEVHLPRFLGALNLKSLGNGNLAPYISQAQDQSKRLFLLIKKYHHELQAFIKQEMERNEITSTLANKELVFFLASALITFPVFGAWMLLSSQFS